MHRRDQPAMQKVTGELLEQLARPGEDGHIASDKCPCLINGIPEGEHGARTVPGSERTLQHQRRLGDIEAMLGAAGLLERDIRLVRVVREPDCLTPPNGAAAFDTTPTLRPIMPVWMLSISRSPRARSRVKA